MLLLGVGGGGVVGGPVSHAHVHFLAVLMLFLRKDHGGPVLHGHARVHFLVVLMLFSQLFFFSVMTQDYIIFTIFVMR